MTRSASIHSGPRSTRRQSEHTLRLVGDSFRPRISGRLTLDTRTADGEADGDVATRGSGVRAGFVCTAHQVERFAVVDLRRVEVECSREAEAALVDGPIPTRAVTCGPVRSSLRPKAIRVSVDWKQAA
jgi:hypothetical protein